MEQDIRTHWPLIFTSIPTFRRSCWSSNTVTDLLKRHEYVERSEQEARESDVHGFTRGATNQDLPNLRSPTSIKLGFLHKPMTDDDDELKEIVFDVQE